ncbi:hypothetical protein BZK31_11465 [Pseudomonas floridensis]|uniref:Uncharacterized protein n=1 Tax=Pseudomonas floridensis TaxID=1958950 RepID=A0A1X0N8C4_9PSED|nr:hypothetical protein [Pseudomonas floridensis]ORC59230.1 hypothetical protein BZK31_11465 [Pseudomonas floridensis]
MSSTIAWGDKLVLMIIIVKCESASAHLKGASFAGAPGGRARTQDATNYFQAPSVLIDDRPAHGAGQGIHQENTMRFDRAHHGFYTGSNGRTVLI